MKKTTQITLFLLLCLNITLHAQEVPATVYYCDVEINLSPDARSRIQEYWRQITTSPRYFNEMVKRAQIYMPFIEEAFAEVQVPRDLKYLAIQESALRADVVSSSKAVGFWQLKQGTATDLKLQVDGDVDERMHIYRSSIAAAQYLKEINRGYSNWLYALLAYYEGPTGSVPYTNPDYYGEKTMNLSGSDHWYVLKAIANKLAYEKALDSNKRPDVFLMPYAAKGGTLVKNILAKHNIEEEEFFRYNKWIHNKKRISRKKIYTYYLPKTGKAYVGHIPDPVKMSDGAYQGRVLAEAPAVGNLRNLQKEEAPDPVIILNESESRDLSSRTVQTKDAFPASPSTANPRLFSPKALDIRENLSEGFVEFQLIHDLHYGLEYVQYTGYTPVAALADRYKKGLAEFLMYNGLVPGEEPEKGRIIYIEKPERRAFHIVVAGEALTEIAADHVSTVERIQNRNRMAADDVTIYVGQKLYLKDRKPKDEKIILLSQKVQYAENNQTATLGEAIEPDTEPVEEQVNTVANKPPKIVQEVLQESPDQAEAKSTEPSNKLDPGKANEALLILNPANSPDTAEKIEPVWVEHIVVAGETLWQLSQKYGTQVDLIKKINKLNKDEISQGQYLRILATKKF